MKKFYAIDVFWPMGKCFKIEADSPEEAQEKVKAELDAILARPTCAIDLREHGFEATEDYEIELVGEGPSKDEIEYS